MDTLLLAEMIVAHREEEEVEEAVAVDIHMEVVVAAVDTHHVDVTAAMAVVEVNISSFLT